MSKNNKAIICGGCFWSIEENFKTKPGIISTEVGYTGGKTDSPTYKSVCSGNTGHAECVKLIFELSDSSGSAETLKDEAPSVLEKSAFALLNAISNLLAVSCSLSPITKLIVKFSMPYKFYFDLFICS